MRRTILILICLLLPIPCFAKLIIVDDDYPADFNSIQAAIYSSNDGDVILVFPGTYTPTVPSTWKTLGGDFDRRGSSQNAGPEFGCVKWRFETHAAVSTSAAVGLNGKIHIACEDGNLYTLDANGTLLWSYDANSPLLSSPTVGPDGAVYVGAENGKLYAIDIDGALRWTHTTAGPIYSSPAISPDTNGVYVCSQDGALYALAQDGTELWTFTTKGPGPAADGSILASPTIGADGTIYIGGLYDPNLYALNPANGTLKWTCTFGHPFDPTDPNSEIVGGWPFASPVIAPDGTIYQTLLYDSNLYAVDSNDGSILWSTNLNVFCDFIEEYLGANGEIPPLDLIEQNCEHWFGLNPSAGYEAFMTYAQSKDASGWSEPALGPDGTIYVSFDDPYLRAVEPNGAIKWVTPLGTTGGYTLTVGSEGLIYAAGDDGGLYVVDAKGWRVAHFQSNNWLNFPVIAAEGLVVVTDGTDDSFLISHSNNTLWAIGSADCSGPTFDLSLIEDMNADGNVNFIDFALAMADWLACTDLQPPCDYQGQLDYQPGDTDRDRYVHFSDIMMITDRWLGDERSPRPPRPLGPLGPPPAWPAAR